MRKWRGFFACRLQKISVFGISDLAFAQAKGINPNPMHRTLGILTGFRSHSEPTGGNEHQLRFLPGRVCNRNCCPWPAHVLMSLAQPLSPDSTRCDPIWTCTHVSPGRPSGSPLRRETEWTNI